MSRKSSSKPGAASPAPATGTAEAAADSRRRGLIIAAAAGVFIAGSVGSLVWFGGRRDRQETAQALRPELNRAHAPSMGDAAARVHIVEFLDPACETCAVFYPLVKQLMSDNPGRIRLSTRHVPLHQGVDQVVRMLEAARAQDRYWQVLESLLANQAQWVPNHITDAPRALSIVAGMGLDMDRLLVDMRAPEVDVRMQQDIDDAKVLNVRATPEYFVNGRQMDNFGRQQLLTLVRTALAAAY